MTDRERKLLKIYARKIKTAVEERVSGDIGKMIERQVDSVRLDLINDILEEESKK